jgi:hypothetical protein
MRERIIPTEPRWSPYPIGRRTEEACREIDRAVSFFGERDQLPPLPPYEQLRPWIKVHDDTTRNIRASDAMLEMGLAPTARISAECVIEELPFVPSDGVPVAIGSDETTKPREAPRSSTAIYTESDHRIRSSGVQW